MEQDFTKSSFLWWPLFGSARWPGGIFYPVVFFNSATPVANLGNWLYRPKLAVLIVFYPFSGRFLVRNLSGWSRQVRRIRLQSFTAQTDLSRIENFSFRLRNGPGQVRLGCKALKSNSPDRLGPSGQVSGQKTAKKLPKNRQNGKFWTGWPASQVS